jgi:hypothetical protein
MENNLIKSEIESRIFTIRGMQVMLDSYLAFIFQVDTKRINEQVKRNISRFPKEFCFQLSNTEWNTMKSQIATSFLKPGGKVKSPWVFTEHGIAMLATRLNSDLAAQISVEIINVFVSVKRSSLDFIKINERLNYLQGREETNAQEIAKIWQFIHANKTPETGIFFQNQIFDAYVFSSELIAKAKRSIILIDNYIDETTLLQLSKRNKKVSCTIYTEKINEQLKLDLEKHNAQYQSIEIRILKNAHDRFIILDEKELYHLGASLKDLGKRWFAFSKMDGLVSQILAHLND